MQPEETQVVKNVKKNRSSSASVASTPVARSAKAEEAAKARNEARRKMMEEKRKMMKAKKSDDADTWPGMFSSTNIKDICLNCFCFIFSYKQTVIAEKQDSAVGEETVV